MDEGVRENMMPSAAPAPLVAPTAPPAAPYLDVAGVSKRYGRQPALQDVSFAVARGEVVGLVGPNGAGKSTTLRIVCGLLTPDAGSVTLDAVDQRRDPARFRLQLGALIESPAWYPSLTAFDHVAYVARLRGCFDGPTLERTLTTLGLDPRSAKPVRQFSLGMRQRLGIAMALLGAPGLLVLDEPMNGLDPVGMAELRGRLRALAAMDGVAVLISSHLLHEIEQMCHRVLFIRDTRLVDDVDLRRNDAESPGTVLLQTGDTASALALLRQWPFVHEAVTVQAGIECRLRPADVPELVRLLVASEIAVHAVVPGQGSLENLYLSQYASPRRGGEK